MNKITTNFENKPQAIDAFSMGTIVKIIASPYPDCINRYAIITKYSEAVAVMLDYGTRIVRSGDIDGLKAVACSPSEAITITPNVSE